MRIKKLELNGFKSFKDRTVIQFDPGTTGIVGPNGCGKSNIVDALVWVMGEMSAKHLRGSSMTDVIFAGAEGYAPMGMAEVSLTLENEGGAFPAQYAKFSEIQITRRLHRSGESEYLINKEQARLRDIQEIFMDTGAGSKGFSIIEQGAIGEMITAKPQDRRVLIEEAAGISKFKVRKKESQRKLVSTEQNLVRLQDIIGEQKRQIGSLERQAQKAERYRNLKQQIEEKDLWLSSHQFSKLDGELKEAQEKFNELQKNEIGQTADMEQLESDLQALKLKLSELENLVNEKQVQFSEQTEKVREQENEIREIEFEIQQAQRDQEKTGSILSQYQARREALKNDLEEINEKLLSLKTEADQAKLEYEEKNQSFEQLKAKIDQADESLSISRRELIATSQAETHLEANLQSAQDKKSEIESDLQEQKESLGQLEQSKKQFLDNRNEVFNKLEQEKQMQLDFMKDVDNFAENYQQLKSSFEQRQKEVADYKENLNEVSGRLYGLENLDSSFEGFQEGVKSVMLWQRQKTQTMHADGSVSEVFQPVAEVVEVPEKYELAMEAGLGTKLQMLLSDDKSQSLEAVDYLKQNNSGRSSFFSGDANQTHAATNIEQIRNESGFNSFLSDVVSVPDKFKGQVSGFLQDVVVVDDISSALKLRANYSGKTFVTLDGDTLSPDGVLTGGSAESADTGLLKRKREIKELSEKREEWAGKLSLAQLTLEKMEKQLKTLEEDLESAKKKQSEHEILIVGLQKDLERSENELANADRAFSSQQEIVNLKEQKLVSQSEQILEMTGSLSELKEKKMAIESTVQELEEVLRTSKNGFDELQTRARDLQVISASKEKELEGVEHQNSIFSQSLAEIEQQISQMDDETQKSVESLSSNSSLIEQKKLDLERSILNTEQSEKSLAQSRDEFEQEHKKSREMEDQLSANHRELNEYKASLNEAQLKLEQLQMKEQYLVEHVQEKYQKDIKFIASEYMQQEGDLELITKEVDELKEKIARMGEVNLSAIEEYDELKDRYEFLSKQHDDLIEAKKQLTKVIDKINRICSVKFKETFEQVDSRFQKVFPVLFGGGEAKLTLIEPEEEAVGSKAEMGIEIMARPPGKKLQSVSLMSGGEKALTAVSLIFSIFLVKPSPYCLLDEVDAPLDDANVMRFNDLVKEMAKRSQIIVVTHNKHTMKVNKKLYGVTMEQKGVSKMVSVDLDAAEKVIES